MLTGMRFEVSERIYSEEKASVLLEALRRQFVKISDSTFLVGQVVKVEGIHTSFGSINRNDTTNVSIEPVKGAYLIVADVHYRPSTWFWVLLIILLFTAVGWLIPIVFYLLQKNIVRTEIEYCFKRIKDEFSSEIPVSATTRKKDAYESVQGDVSSSLNIKASMSSKAEVGDELEMGKQWLQLLFGPGQTLVQIFCIIIILVSIILFIIAQ